MADRFNQQLAAITTSPNDRPKDYRVGPGDVLEIAVFQADELNRRVRVRPDGSISYPLLGFLIVAGQTTGELERTLATRLAETYLHEPDVSVFVSEYRAHPVSVLGEVNKPGVYYLQEPRTVLEMLSEAGGLTEKAGRIVHLRRKTRSREGGRPGLAFLSVELEELVADHQQGFDVAVHRGDTVYVPKEGVVYVEGAVRKPGAFPLSGATTVLKAVALAGGLDGSARKSRVQVIRAGSTHPDVVHVDFDEIRRNPRSDVAIQDGDVVVVSSSLIKIGLLGFWRTFAGLLNVTKSF